MPKKADNEVTGEPVPGFPIEFTWHTGEWLRIFDEQIKLVRSDVMRARLEGRLTIYLSVPISSRGGSFESTNVDIAMATERRLLDRWGEGVWVLNPARYQMESKGGYGLIEKHARDLSIDLAKLLDTVGNPSGGDYMRMWTKVLVEDDDKNLGRRFDGYYFLGPSDVHTFLGVGPESGTRAINEYFSSRFSTDAEFRYAYTGKMDIDWGKRDPEKFLPDDWKPLEAWDALRRDFLRFYLLRASANYSKGCHDEWNIWVRLNHARIAATANPGDQIAGYFDGRQVDPASGGTLTSNGYAIP